MSDPTSTRDQEVRRDCHFRIAGASWWDWECGSTLFFWRWPTYARHLARDGHPIWVMGQLPTYTKPQPFEKDEKMWLCIKKKLDKVRERRYIVAREVRTLTSYFAVPKGTDYIHMVYNASKSWLNFQAWVPSFSLPTTDNLTDLLKHNSWMADLDMGEQFLNFPLDNNIQSYCGIDLRPYYDTNNEHGKTWWEGWCQCMMGFKPSPLCGH